ncbi:MAG: hypothetical protein K2M79_06050 [Muribaculaceae bacterium]|nr:hypothetical protein [Muribaculaceae bacterium]
MKKLFYTLAILFSSAVTLTALNAHIDSGIPVEVDEDEDTIVVVEDLPFTVVEIVDDSDSVYWDYEDEDLGYRQPCYSCSSDYFDSIGQPFPLRDYETLMAQEDFATLAMKADSVLTVLPGDPFALYMSGYADAMMGNLVEGALAATSLLSSYPMDYSARDLVAYIAAQNPDLTIPLLATLGEGRKALGIYTPVEEEFHRQTLANLWLNAGEPDRALEIVAQADSIGIEIPGWIQIKAVAFADKGDSEKALEIISTVEEEDRDLVWMENYAIYLRNARGIEASNEYIEEVLKEYPYDEQLKETYGLNLALKGDYGRALEVFRQLRAEAENENDQLFYDMRLGMVYSMAGKKIEAGQQFSIILSDPEATETEIMVAKAYSHIGNPDELITEEMIAERPAFYAGIYNVYGNQEKALDLLGRAYETYTWRPDATQYDINLRSLLKHPEYPKALARFRK